MVRLSSILLAVSIAAFTTRERVARALVPTWQILMDYDWRNDGQLLPIDSLLPGSSLLHYLNADHWAAAMQIERELGFLSHRDDPTPFTLETLLAAMLQYVGDKVNDPPLPTATLPAQVPRELP